MPFKEVLLDKKRHNSGGKRGVIYSRAVLEKCKKSGLQ